MCYQQELSRRSRSQTYSEEAGWCCDFPDVKGSESAKLKIQIKEKINEVSGFTKNKYNMRQTIQNGVRATGAENVEEE